MQKNGTDTAVYQIDAEESKRISILRLWLCILVVFIHSNIINGTRLADGILIRNCPEWLSWAEFIIHWVAASCAVPWFFMLSAVFLYRKPFRWLDNMKKKVKTLLIPYLILNTFWLAFYCAAQSIPAARTFFSNSELNISSLTAKDIIHVYLTGPLVGPLWFLRDLMVLNVLAVGIRKIIDRFPKTVFAILVLILILEFKLKRYISNHELYALVYFCLGYYCVKYRFSFKKFDDIRPAITVPLYMAAALLACLLKDTDALWLCRIPAVIFGGGGVLFTYATRFENRAIEDAALYLSRYSMAIYLFHPMSIIIMQKLAARLLPINGFTQAFCYFGIPLIDITLCVAFSGLLKRYTPKLYNAVTGSRG